MKKLIAGVAALAAVVLAAPAGTQAQDDVEVMLLHGIPGVPVDVAVDGEVLIPGFEPGAMQDLSSFAGQTLANLEVRLAGTEDVAIGPVAEFAVPASGSWTVVAHLDADGTPTVTPFENDTSTTTDGEGRLTVRHTAAALPSTWSSGMHARSKAPRTAPAPTSNCRQARSPELSSHRRAPTRSSTSRP